MDSALWNETASMPSVSPSLDAMLLGTTLLDIGGSTNVSSDVGLVRGGPTAGIPENSTASPQPCTTTMMTTTSSMVTCDGFATNMDAGNGSEYTYHVNSDSHTMIYIGIILAVYFTALTVVIVRYFSKERHFYVRTGNRTLKKDKFDRKREARAGERFLLASRSRDAEPSTSHHFGGGGGGCRTLDRVRDQEPQPLQLIVPPQFSTQKTLTTAVVHMDTAV